MNNCKSCKTCIFFEERSSFCRLNPPVPTIIKEKNYNNKSEDFLKVKSLYPIIQFPDLDWCSKYQSKTLSE